MFKLRSDGRVMVTDKATGKSAWLYPVDAREALQAGSHELPPGVTLPGNEATEMAAMRKRIEELEQQVSEKSTVAASTDMPPAATGAPTKSDAPRSPAAADPAARAARV